MLKWKKKENRNDPPQLHLSFFPSQTDKKDKETSPHSQPVLSPEAAIKDNVKYSRIIFDWCRWEWSFTGRRGIWDTDFRFETYSLGLVYLADTEIDILVEFDKNAENGSDYFKKWKCLSIQEQLQVNPSFLLSPYQDAAFIFLPRSLVAAFFFPSLFPFLFSSFLSILTFFSSFLPLSFMPHRRYLRLAWLVEKLVCYYESTCLLKLSLAGLLSLS